MNVTVMVLGVRCWVNSTSGVGEVLGDLRSRLLLTQPWPKGHATRTTR
ncbi:MAG: hypothetical protein F6J90_02875 [Moorea sp. SIOASIH]|nr:hypothetical protein [Moorena sp. SIOASIH]